MNKNKQNEGVAPSETGQNEPQPQKPNEKDALAKQLADYKDSLQRLQAEFENYKKRVDKEKVQFQQFATAEVVKSLLSVLDSFELALKSVNSPAAAANEKMAKGMEMIYGQFYSALEAQGLRPIKALGEKFDPYRHEVLMQEETADEKKDGIVVEEFQKGYALNDVILRYSKVKVLKFAKINQDKSNVSGGK
ncbi:nucleotide exchange factor GrpE [Candidatus Woesearchaeota archaeon]|nr:nucleotide exchange factor GrpE [Candidatus Woesearchaeota archaeon]